MKIVEALVRYTTLGLILAAAVLSAGAASAQEFGNPGRGKIYATAHCADCHAVDAEARRSPLPTAPGFRKIANIPGMTPMALTAWLHGTHKTMPNLVVMGDDLHDVIAYIRSLRTAAPQPQ
jgi:mono/diheme cytochrome c family protein